jgi:hypothetical protein
MLGAFVGRFGFAVCLFLIGCVFASAQNAQPPVYGFGAASCSTYLSEIKMRGEQAKALYFSWAQGFISAANALTNSPEYPLVPNLTSKIGLDAQGVALVQLCSEKPNQEFSRAVMELLDRIREAEGLRPLLR